MTQLNIENQTIFSGLNLSHDDIYSARFRSEPMALSNYLLGFSEDDVENIKEELVDGLKEALFFKETGCKVLDESDFMDLNDFISSFESQHCLIENQLNDDTQICDLVNYKGEGEGVALFSLIKDLNIFVSKHHYK